MIVFLWGFVFAILGYFYFKHLQFKLRFDAFKSPQAHPIIGHALKIGTEPKALLESIWRWTKEMQNDLYVIWLGFDPFVFLTEPKHVEALLSSTKVLSKSDLYDCLHPWLHQGLLTSDGSKWHKRRKIITPSFHFKILVDFLEVMSECGDKFVEKLSSKAKTQEIFDFQSIVHYHTLDVVCETAMGVKLNMMDQTNSDMYNAFTNICNIMMSRMVNVLQKPDILFMFTSRYRQQQKILKYLSDFTAKVVEDRRKQHASTSKNSNEEETRIKQRHAFLDTLLEATVDGLPLSSSDIEEEVATFIFEGHDTTASGLAFAVYILSTHPDIQQKAFEEQATIFGKDTDRRPTFQEVQDMKYLEMVIKESQRLYPSVPFIGRYAKESFNIDGKIFPPKTRFIVNIMGMGYNEAYFKDPLKIDPERFNAESRVNTNPYEYVPFSAGPRNCIGQKFAMLEMKSALSKIIRNFEIFPPTDGLCRDGYSDDMSKSNQYHPVLSTSLTLKSDNGIQIRLRERNIEQRKLTSE